MKMEQTECYSHCHIYFRCQGITQKKEYNIHNSECLISRIIWIDALWE